MRKKIVMFWMTLLSCCTIGCGSEKSLSSSTKQLSTVRNDTQQKTEKLEQSVGQQEENANSKNEDEMKENYDAFAISMLQHTYAAGENEMISPLSILAALTMTENGAKENTLLQMEQVLAQGVCVEEWGDWLSSYLNNLCDTKETHCNIANSIWAKESGKDGMISDDFLQKNQTQFDADIFLAPFDERTLEDINRWVSNETDGMIPSILDKIEPESVMYLINAVAFDAQWMEPYEKADVKKEVFTRQDGTKCDVEMMYAVEKRYLEDETTIGFVKPYQEGYSFVALLPKETISMQDYITQLSAQKWIALVSNVSREFEVNTALPKFSSSYTIELCDTLKELGMTDAFDPYLADFSGIGTGANGNLFIDLVLHKTYIEVDEQGTKASAATIVGMRESATERSQEQKTVYLNRPFVYAIVDNETMLPVFLGVMEDIDVIHRNN